MSVTQCPMVYLYLIKKGNWDKLVCEKAVSQLRSQRGEIKIPLMFVIQEQPVIAISIESEFIKKFKYRLWPGFCTLISRSSALRLSENH